MNGQGLLKVVQVAQFGNKLRRLIHRAEIIGLAAMNEHTPAAEGVEPGLGASVAEMTLPEVWLVKFSLESFDNRRYRK
jgi:hypothetical protein